MNPKRTVVPNVCPLGKLLAATSENGLERPTYSPSSSSPARATTAATPPTMVNPNAARAMPRSQRKNIPEAAIAKTG